MIKRIFLNDKIILILILINALLIFISGFNLSEKTLFLIHAIDNIITGLFLMEIMVKVNEFGVKSYFKSNWNKLDFLLVTFSIPAFITFIFNAHDSAVSFLLVFRLMRVFKSFRFLKFIPGVDQLFRDIKRALKASVIVLIGFVIYIFIVGVFSFHLFEASAPQYFSNPLTSLYSIFKIFTVEGWFEIPETITVGYSPSKAFFTYAYFIFILLTGGIFGLSLVNSIFVDAMVSDNNDELEKKIDNLEQKIDALLAQQQVKNGVGKKEESLTSDLHDA